MNTLQIQIDKLNTSKDQDFIIVNNYRYKKHRVNHNTTIYFICYNIDCNATLIQNIIYFLSH